MKVYERNEDCFAYPDEMKQILDYLNERGTINVNASTIESLYYDFSYERYCAGWMGVNEDILAEFERWLTNVEF